jgi:hypothetical protein
MRETRTKVVAWSCITSAGAEKFAQFARNVACAARKGQRKNSRDQLRFNWATRPAYADIAGVMRSPACAMHQAGMHETS